MTTYKWTTGRGANVELTVDVKHITTETVNTMQYKKAESQGAYIDRLRTKYPFRICRTSEPQYEAVLCGVQPLLDGQEMPLYRFPSGVCCEDPIGNGITILEW